MTVLAGTDKRRRAGPAPPSREPWPHSAVAAPVAPAGEYETEPYTRHEDEPVPPDATRVRWLELPPTLAPYVRLGMRYYDGERQIIFRIIRELGEPEGYAEAMGRRRLCEKLGRRFLISAISSTASLTAWSPPKEGNRGSHNHD